MVTTIATVLFLVFLEGVLSFDNALVLAVLAEGLPKEQQKKALTYGMWGAMGFRFLALTVLTYLLHAVWIKFVGAGYLLWLCLSHFLKKEDEEDPIVAKKFNFWKTIAVIELTDVAFSSDSILASIGVSNNFWILFTGAVLGIATMRIAAILFLKLIEKFPNLERSAYLLVGAIGAKLLFEGLNLPGVDFHNQADLACQAFWVLMTLCIGSGFLPKHPEVSIA